MKKYIMGTLAIVMALGFCAFTKKSVGKATLHKSTFGFIGDPSLQGEVADPLNWIDARDLGPLCVSGGNEFACKIRISDAYTHLEGDLQVLNTECNNPQSEQIITIPEILSYAYLYKVDEMTVSEFEVDNADLD